MRGGPEDLCELTDPSTAFALDGRVLSNTHGATEVVRFSISGNHQKTISFYVFHSPLVPIVLGHPWLYYIIPRLIE